MSQVWAMGGDDRDRRDALWTGRFGRSRAGLGRHGENDGGRTGGNAGRVQLHGNERFRRGRCSDVRLHLVPVHPGGAAVDSVHALASRLRYAASRGGADAWRHRSFTDRVCGIHGRRLSPGRESYASRSPRNLEPARRWRGCSLNHHPVRFSLPARAARPRQSDGVAANENADFAHRPPPPRNTP